MVSITRRTALSAAITTAICGLVAATPLHAQELKQVTVVLPHPGAIGHFPMHIARCEGYFEKQGINVTVQAVDGSGQVIQAVAAGQGDIGNAGPGPLLSARVQGVDVVMFYNHFAKSQFGILVAQDAPFKELTELKGKVIGVGTADGAEVSFARSMFTASGMTEGTDYTFLPVGDSGPAAVAFQRGDISAYAAATADAAILRTRGMEVRDFTPEAFQGFFGNGYMATRAYIDANPDIIKGFGRALVQGAIFGSDPANREKVLECSAKANPQEAEDKVMLEALFDNMRLRVQPLDPSKGRGYYSAEAWKAWEDSLVASGGLKAPLPDLDKAYTNEFVSYWNEGVNP